LMIALQQTGPELIMIDKSCEKAMKKS